VIAAPAAWWAMSQWLTGFAYPIDYQLVDVRSMAGLNGVIDCGSDGKLSRQLKPH
jgi:hypothetical protein